MNHRISGGENFTLYPVILPVPNAARDFSVRKKVRFLSEFARQAVILSADKSNLRLGELLKDANGAPVPSNGIFWSVTHKSEFVGGVVSRHPIGLDIEKVKPCSQELMDKVAEEKEWALSTGRSDRLFFRYWTAKEAVLKAMGTGLKDLSRCKIEKLVDETHLGVRYEDRIWNIEHYYFEGHTAAMVKEQGSIHWTIESLITAERLIPVVGIE